MARRTNGQNKAGTNHGSEGGGSLLPVVAGDGDPKPDGVGRSRPRENTRQAEPKSDNPWSESRIAPHEWEERTEAPNAIYLGQFTTGFGGTVDVYRFRERSEKPLVVALVPPTDGTSEQLPDVVLWTHPAPKQADVAAAYQFACRLLAETFGFRELAELPPGPQREVIVDDAAAGEPAPTSAAA